MTLHYFKYSGTWKFSSCGSLRVTTWRLGPSSLRATPMFTESGITVHSQHLLQGIHLISHRMQTNQWLASLAQWTSASQYISLQLTENVSFREVILLSSFPQTVCSLRCATVTTPPCADCLWMHGGCWLIYWGEKLEDSVRKEEGCSIMRVLEVCSHPNK